MHNVLICITKMSGDRPELSLFPSERAVMPENALVSEGSAQVIDLACYALTKLRVTPIIPEESVTIDWLAHGYEKHAYLRCLDLGILPGSHEANELRTDAVRRATTEVVSQRPDA